ncbi:hypothetical protein SCALM49S_10338 [Streptomyces californicus]
MWPLSPVAPGARTRASTAGSRRSSGSEPRRNASGRTQTPTGAIGLERGLPARAPQPMSRGIASRAWACERPSKDWRRKPNGRSASTNGSRQPTTGPSRRVSPQICAPPRAPLSPERELPAVTRLGHLREALAAVAIALARVHGPMAWFLGAAATALTPVLRWRAVPAPHGHTFGAVPPSLRHYAEAEAAVRRLQDTLTRLADRLNPSESTLHSRTRSANAARCHGTTARAPARTSPELHDARLTRSAPRPAAPGRPSLVAPASQRSFAALPVRCAQPPFVELAVGVAGHGGDEVEGPGPFVTG